MMLHILGALLLPLCGWLAGDAIQARTVQHLAALQKCLALLERIRQEVAFRRADLQQLYAELCREGILESGTRCLQEAPPPEGLTREESFAYYQSREPEELFDVKEAPQPVPERARIFRNVICDGCGETAGEPWTVLREGKRLCLSCADRAGREE